MKVMVFVIDNLYSDIENPKFFINNKELTILYQEWNEMYIISRYKEFSKSNLKKFEVTYLILI